MGALLARLTQPLRIGALLAMAGLGAALMLSRARLETARQALAAERALHAADVAAFTTMQDRADADWRAEIARIQSANRRKNDEADRRADAARTDYTARVLRLPAATANPGLSSDREMPGAGVPARADGPGGDTVLLARSDALNCATNTARLLAAHEWALELADQAKATR